jgi:hypothetical protein
MATVEMEDVSPGGHVLSHATVAELPARAPLRDVLAARIDAEVATYNADPGPVYHGLVQPEDAVRYSDGFRMRAPRRLDAAHLLRAVEEAVAAGVVVFRVGDDTVVDLDHEVAVDEVECITTVMRRPIVARGP